MDRFIATVNTVRYLYLQYLKSSLDRFIEGGNFMTTKKVENLKSSLDRFIVNQVKKYDAWRGI